MKKTALQQLIEQLESMKNNHPHKTMFDEGIHEGLRCAIREARHSIETEQNKQTCGFCVNKNHYI